MGFLKGTEWIGGEESKKKIRIYHLVNSALHKRYNDNPNDPDLYKGIEYEPYMLWIIESGFKDLFHTIIESPELDDGIYEMLYTRQVEDKFKLEL